jgi:hypothetical protein
MRIGLGGGATTPPHYLELESSSNLGFEMDRERAKFA